MTTIVVILTIPARTHGAAILKSSNASFAKALRDLRKARGISQEALAFDAGLDRTYISLLELGRRSPTLETMMAIACALGISLTELAAATEAAMLDSGDSDTPPRVR